MKNGVIETAADARWLIASGRPEYMDADVFTAALGPVALFYAYELTRNADARDLRVDKDGWLLIELNDDVNPPGWYHYRKRATEEEARAAVAKHFGDVVRLPLYAIRSTREVSN